MGPIDPFFSSRFVCRSKGLGRLTLERDLFLGKNSIMIKLASGPTDLCGQFGKKWGSWLGMEITPYSNGQHPLSKSGHPCHSGSTIWFIG